MRCPLFQRMPGDRGGYVNQRAAGIPGAGLAIDDAHTAGVDHGGQRAEVCGNGAGSVGVRQEREARLHPARQTGRERLHRELQRAASAGVFKPASLPGPGGSQEDDRAVAHPVQCLQASQVPERHDARRFC